MKSISLHRYWVENLDLPQADRISIHNEAFRVFERTFWGRSTRVTNIVLAVWIGLACVVFRPRGSWMNLGAFLIVGFGISIAIRSAANYYCVREYKQSVFRTLRKRGYGVCRWCGYVIRPDVGFATSIQCPECGRLDEGVGAQDPMGTPGSRIVGARDSIASPESAVMPLSGSDDEGYRPSAPR